MVRRGIFVRTLAVLAAVVLAGVIAPTPAQAGGTGTSVFVAAWGDDRAGGRVWWQPVRTLQRARDLVRTLIPTMDADITVRLLPGTYWSIMARKLEKRMTAGPAKG